MVINFIYLDKVMRTYKEIHIVKMVSKDNLNFIPMPKVVIESAQNFMKEVVII